ncbi:MAG: hypothetical protein LBV00_04130 [Propionibacteriaceae bacterium]|nr:hypothetical protein [Propionibacteriaceae bacterium]
MTSTPIDPIDWDDINQPNQALPAGGPPHPIVWAALTADQAEFEWLALNEWVEDLRRVFSIPVQIIPPFWHRHSLLVEHLSALHTHWQAAFDPDQHGSAPFGWVRDLDEWKTRMREATAQLGCRPDTCRPETTSRWPGQPDPEPDEWPPPVNQTDRYDDFVTLVLWDVRRRRTIEARYLALMDDAEGGDDE